MKDAFQQTLPKQHTCFEKLEKRAEGRIEMKKEIFTCKIKKKNLKENIECKVGGVGGLVCLFATACL